MVLVPKPNVGMKVMVKVPCTEIGKIVGTSTHVSEKGKKVKNKRQKYVGGERLSKSGS